MLDILTALINFLMLLEKFLSIDFSHLLGLD